MSRKALTGVSARSAEWMPRFTVHSVPEAARSVSLPAPTGGWDTVTPIAAMPEDHALTLDNLFPQAGFIEIRGGHRQHNIMAGVASSTESLLPYHALISANDKLFAATGTAIYDVTTTASTTIAASLTGLSNSRFQHINFGTSGGNFLWICNGANVPFTWNGAVWATASVTGITPTDVVGVTAFKQRIWMVRKDTLSPAYLPPDSIQGAATIFDLAGVFQKGGYLQAIGAWTLDGGDGSDDYLAFISSRGEVAIYTGTDPAATFSLRGVYMMGAPLGRRCITKMGADLAVISKDGVSPLSRALITDRADAINASITKNIQPTMTDSARLYGDNFGWEILSYPHGNRIILNVPITANVEQQQYVMNAITGAWCRFLRENANCWAVFKDRLFYGTNDGKVFEADVQGFDHDGSIDYDMETAFNVCESKGRFKEFTMCRALLTADGQTAPGLAINVDFARQTPVNQVSIPAVPLVYWDVGTWDVSTWPATERILTNWTAVNGQGYYGSIRMKGSAMSSVPTDTLAFAVNGFDLLVKDGAFM